MSKIKLVGIIVISIAIGANAMMLFQHFLRYGFDAPVFPATGALIILIIVLFSIVRKILKNI
jgi:hypothetical protein